MLYPASDRADPHSLSDDSSEAEAGGSFYNEAVLLARKGHAEQAMRLLQRAVDAKECTLADALVFRGKVLVRDGRHLEAEASWLQALKLDPGNVAARAALERLRLERLPSWRLTRGLKVAAFLLLLGAVTAYGALQLRHLKEAQADAAAQARLLNLSNQALADATLALRDASQRRIAELTKAIEATRTDLQALAKTLPPQREQDRDAIANLIKTENEAADKRWAAQLRDAVAGLRGISDKQDEQRQTDRDTVLAAVKKIDSATTLLGESLAKSQHDFEAELKSISARQGQDAKDLQTRLERYKKESDAKVDAYQAALAELGQRLDRELKALTEQMQAGRDLSEQAFWLRLPESKGAKVGVVPSPPATQPSP